MSTSGKLTKKEVQRQVASQWSETERLIMESDNPHHRAILENYRRHALLELCERMDELTAPDMMVRHPYYTMNGPEGRFIYDGWDAVRYGLYGALADAGEALMVKEQASIAVADWGFSVEQLIHYHMYGREARKRGYDIDDDDAVYVESAWTAMAWHYSEDALLIGERVYKAPPESFEKVDEALILSLADVREVLEPMIDAGPFRP